MELSSLMRSLRSSVAGCDMLGFSFLAFSCCDRTRMLMLMPRRGLNVRMLGLLNRSNIKKQMRMRLRSLILMSANATAMAHGIHTRIVMAKGTVPYTFAMLAQSA